MPWSFLGVLGAILALGIVAAECAQPHEAGFS